MPPAPSGPRPRWRLAPMKKSMGIENRVLVREARNARRPAAAAAGSAWPPPRTAFVDAMTICCFGQMTIQTFRNMRVPIVAPMRIIEKAEPSR